MNVVRSYVVFGALVLMVAAFVYVVATRTRAPYATPNAPDAASWPDASDDGRPEPSNEDAAPPPLMDRPLRVTATGWDLLAGGIIENGGATKAGPGSGFGPLHLSVELVATDTAGVESKLARGGDDPQGADVAILPLPVFVAAYERLRALEPEVFFVVDWSRGRDGMTGRSDASLSAAPPGDVKVASAGSDAPTMLALSALDLLGVSTSRVKLVKADDDDAKGALFTAVDRARGAPADAPRRLLLTTADATELVPFIALASHAFIEAHGPALRALAQGWLQGLEQLKKDVPGAARKVAALQGAPEAVALLVQLGQLEGATLGDNARLMALSGRGAVTLERLFVREWAIWRAAGTLSTPAPENAPLATAVVASLVRADPSRVQPSPSSLPSADAHADAAPEVTKGGTVTLVRSEPPGKVDEAKVVADIGWMAGVFARSTIRVTLADKKVAARVAASAREQFDLGGARVALGARPLGTASAAIEVIAP